MRLWLPWMFLIALPAQQAVPDALQLAQRQFELGQYRQAAAALQAAPGLVRDARLQHWLGRAYYELRDWEKAVAASERAVALDPSRAEYHQWLARAYGEKAERDRSLFMARKVKRELEEAVRLDPSAVTARRDLLHYYAEAPWIAGGSKDKARQQAEAIAALDPIQGHLAWADYWKEQDKPDEVERRYQSVRQASPATADPYFEMAEYYQRRNDAARLEQAIEQAAGVHPQDPRLAYFRGTARVLAGDRAAQAEQMLRAYLGSPENSEYPSHASALEWLGRLFERQGKLKDAADQYRAALQVDPDHESARAGLKRVGR
jgi:tetratricopeptide (TPR) repeat protein